MTGYGRGESSVEGDKITVELSSVNRKQGEISIYREEVNRQVSRGRLTLRVNLHAADGQAATVRVNTALAKAYAKELTRLAKDLRIDDAVSLDLLVRAPGVLRTEEETTDAEGYWPAVEQALRKGLGDLVKMREREGAHLAKDLTSRVKLMKKAVTQVQKQAPAVQERYRQQLIERVKAAGLESPAPDDERLLKEIVYFADRSDISEELARLQSHFQQFDDCLATKEPVGRTLDFLAQEMNREINTIGSKANDSLISREVVLLKTELEKFREQAQNVE
jgi:uncharacterized protein (TIGR00255 family)